jgi:spermidine synthase
MNYLTGLLFAASGAFGLVYQIVWFKYLSLFLGSTTYAQTIVLATFMGGLAIGSALFGRRADKSALPLRLYAFLETGIAVYCLIYPSILEYMKTGFVSVVLSLNLPMEGFSILFLKIIFSAVSLLVPTVLMGGTMPVLVKFTSRKLQESGPNIAVLYFLNSFGAVIGSLLAGFFSIRILGLSVTIYSAGAGSLLIGLSAMALSFVSISSKKMGTAGFKENGASYSRHEVLLAVSVAGISGLAAMIYEIAWVRLLIPVLGSSTYSFSLMLAAFISGITAGSLLVTMKMHGNNRLPSLLGWCQVLTGLSMLAILPLYSRLPYEFWKIGSMFARNNSAYPIFLAVEFLFCFLLMMVPTVFLGMSLPLAARIASRKIKGLGKSVGNVFAVNTFGTVAGALATGLVLIPAVGIKHTFETGITLNIAAGLLVLGYSVSHRKLAVVISGLLLSSLVYGLFIRDWNRNIFVFGVYRFIHSNVRIPDSYSDFENSVSRSNRLVFYREGNSANVSVTENGKQKILLVNGKPDASSGEDLPTQVLCGQLPFLLADDPQDILVVGLGSGVTAGSVLTHPVRRVDCVEILKEVADASLCFNGINNRPLEDRRMHLFIEDALTFLKIEPRKYDIIVNEPTNPWIAGVGSLFTKEFFEVCSEKLKPGGCMVQWFHLYEMDDDLFKMIIRTFRSSFPFITVWHPLNEDVIMIGSEGPQIVDYDRVRSAISRESVRNDLKRIGIHDLATLLSMQSMSAGSVKKYTGTGVLNTEDLPLLEYNAPRAFFLNARVINLSAYDERMKLNAQDILLKKYAEEKILSETELRNIGFYHTDRRGSNLSFGYSVLRNLYDRGRYDDKLLERLEITAEKLNRNEEAAGYLGELVRRRPNDSGVLENYANLKYSIDRRRGTVLTPITVAETERLLRSCISLSGDTIDRYHLRMAEIFYDVQSYKEAVSQYKKALLLRGKYAPQDIMQNDVLLLRIAQCYNNLNNVDSAVVYAAAAVDINRKNSDAADLLIELWSGHTTAIKTK